MKKIVALLVISGALFGASISSNGSGGGFWDATTTWAGGVVPGNGDTITLAASDIVTVRDTRIVGTSPTAGTVVIHFGAAGQLLFSVGGFLRVRGDASYVAGLGSNTTQLLTVVSGSTWMWDSSAAASPLTTTYSLYPDGPGGLRPISCTGSSSWSPAISAQNLFLAPAVMTSDSRGANGFFSTGGNGSSGYYTLTHCRVERIGDSTNPAFSIQWVSTARWDSEYTQFRDSGGLDFNTAGTAFMVSNSTLIHHYNVHSGSLSVHGPMQVYSLSVGPGTGTLDIIGNVFDNIPADQAIVGGFTITGNYFGNEWEFSTGAAAVTFSGNVLRSDGVAGTSQSFYVPTNVTDTYFFLDNTQSNPHILGYPTAGFTANRVIWGQSADAGIYMSPGDSGEFMFGINEASPSDQTRLLNSILLPNALGFSSLEIGAWTNATSHNSVVEHNAWFGGFAATGVGDPFAAMQLSEGGNVPAGVVVSFRSNILFNPELTSFTSQFYKMADISGSSTPTQDICAPATCDYNTGWNHTLTDTISSGHTFLTNQGKGYAAKWSVTPGAHDVDQNPQFVDFQRTIELFDTKYLGYSPLAWDGSQVYVVGKMVQASNATVYWGLPINYRYINASGCGATNPMPGSGTNWRLCWEFASLYHIREGVAQQKLYTDVSIGINNQGIISVLLAWIRAGYATQNTALRGAAHDGTDIGPMPVVNGFPACSAGVSQTFGTGETFTLDGSGTTGATSYLWTFLVGPTSVSITGATSAIATTNSSAFLHGSYNFQLAASNTTGTTYCQVKHGFVPTNSHRVVQYSTIDPTNGAKIQARIGPSTRIDSIALPASRTPFDSTVNKIALDTLTAHSHSGEQYGPWWRDFQPGYCTLTGNSTAVVCIGTHLTDMAVMGVPRSGTVMSFRYAGTTDGFDHFFRSSVASVTDDTHAVLMNQYPLHSGISATNQMPNCDVACTNLSYTWGRDGDLGYGSYANGNAPGCYYDSCGVGYKRYFLRSGIDDYETEFQHQIGNWWQNPNIDQGSACDFTNAVFNCPENRAQNMNGLALLALEGSNFTIMHPGLDLMWGTAANLLGALNSNLFMSEDSRRDGLALQQVSLQVEIDTNSGHRSAAQTALSNSTTHWDAVQQSDHSFATWYSSGGCSVTQLSECAGGSVTASGTTVTCNSCTFASFAGTAFIWMWSTSPNNFPTYGSGDSIYYTATYVDSTHVSISPTYAGTPGSGKGYSLSSFVPFAGYVTQPFSAGILDTGFEQTGNSLDDGSHVTARDKFRGYADNITQWIITNALDPVSGGVFSGVAYTCGIPVLHASDMCTGSISGPSTDGSRSLAAEDIDGLARNGFRKGNQATLNTAALLVDQMFAKPGTGAINPNSLYICAWDSPSSGCSWGGIGAGAYYNYFYTTGNGPKEVGQFFGYPVPTDITAWLGGLPSTNTPGAVIGKGFFGGLTQ